ncbi:MAG: hypothetical protein ACPGGK_08335 [Pikeienuella sp.]
MTNISLIYAVDDLDVLISRSSPQFVLINAKGRVNSVGWTGAALARRHYVVPPEDGVQAFDFFAVPPDEPSLQMLAPIQAMSELGPIDVVNYWGEGVPLTGIRVHAATNDRTALFHSANYEDAISARMMPSVAYITPEEPGRTLSYAADIRHLFRDKDARIMRAVAAFDLHKYEDVRDNADNILNHLRVDMPCDGLWPQSDIDRFADWIDAGKPE